MNRLYVFFGFLLAGLVFSGFASNAAAQEREIYSGTLISYGSGFQTRTITTNFQLNLTGTTSDQQAQSNLEVLKEGNSQDLLKAIEKEDLGRFSVNSNVGVPVNVVRESMIDGKKRILVVFQRLTQFAELRGGYRSLDYPFGYIELFIDPATGKGEGTYIAAAKIRWNVDKKTNQAQVEIENFATYPARLIGVTTDIEGKKKRRVRIGK